jgi:ABC-type multidrug transport system ATPase subunit
MENLRFFCRLYGVSDSNDRLMALLERVGLRRRANDPVRSFSRGLQQRVGIARVLLHDPSLILLDEPYTGLDGQAVAILNEILDEIVAESRTVILTTHDLEQGLRAATRALVMDRGKIVVSSTAGDPAIREAYSRFILSGAKR